MKPWAGFFRSTEAATIEQKKMYELVTKGDMLVG